MASFTRYTTDYLGSDDMDQILEMSLEHETAPGPSTLHVRSDSPIPASAKEPSYIRKQQITKEISALEGEMRDIDEEIKARRALRADLARQREGLLQGLEQLRMASLPKHAVQTATMGSKGKQNQRIAIDYASDGWDWTGKMKSTMRQVFGIHEFRLCQEAVCNANLDGRDIVCVMPTGGGKSLTYQLPALLVPGCTLVISPLISLITDQILHLHEAGVEAVMMTGATSKSEATDIRARLIGARRNKRFDDAHSRDEKEIKLCYVTPEKISKSKTFKAMLQAMDLAGTLARIVIDEAHCISTMGHDFRPDYKELSALRVLFPRVPILCLSATCPPKVRDDILHMLRLKPIVPSTGADREGTVYFSAPLYRKNLHYRVLSKPAAAKDALRAMAKYIIDNHPDDSGIVYCFRKKDTEEVASGLEQWSEGKIKTGIYHADVDDQQKELLHKRWRHGAIKVVCATIAFGLGIDKGDVRFVLHHSMSKSLDAFYQETGRAGRDGKDADCVLYYRPQDASSLSGLMYRDRDGMEKLLQMMRFAHDVEECRKIHFAKHFSASSQLSLAAWQTDSSAPLDRCGHCDNCTRPPESIDLKDVTLEAWQILRIAEEVERQGGRVSLGMISDLARGAGGGAFGVVNGGGGRRGKMKSKEKAELDLESIAGGKVALSKDDTEKVVVELLLSRHLEEAFSATAYTTNVYVVPGRNALRLTRLSREDVQEGKGQRISCCLLKKETTRTHTAKSNKSSRKCSQKAAADVDEDNALSASARSTKRKRQRADRGSDPPPDSDEHDAAYMLADSNLFNPEHEDEDGDSTWTMTVTASPPRKKHRIRTRSAAGRSRSKADDIITLSD